MPLNDSVLMLFSHAALVTTRQKSWPTAGPHVLASGRSHSDNCAGSRGGRDSRPMDAILDKGRLCSLIIEMINIGTMAMYLRVLSRNVIKALDHKGLSIFRIFAIQIFPQLSRETIVQHRLYTLELYFSQHVPRTGVRANHR